MKNIIEELVETEEDPDIYMVKIILLCYFGTFGNDIGEKNRKMIENYFVNFSDEVCYQFFGILVRILYDCGCSLIDLFERREKEQGKQVSFKLESRKILFLLLQNFWIVYKNNI